MNLPPPETVLAIAIVIFLAIGLHEFAHCKMADLAGDPTPGMFGRVTLNLTKHFELMGTIMIAITSISGFGIGWGKPAPMDMRKMRNPRWDFFAAVAAGPISNVLQAAVYAVMLRIALGGKLVLTSEVLAAFDPELGRTLGFTGDPSFLAAFLGLGVLINLSLCFFNLLPLGPLDGHWLLGTFLPDATRIRWYLWNRNYGTMLLIVLVVVGQLGGTGVLTRIIGPPIWASFKFFTGMRI